MYWILDVVVLLLLALTVFCSIKAGITGIFGGVLRFVLRVALLVAITAGFLFLFQVFGIIDARSAAFLKVVGNSGIYPSQYVCDGFAIAVFALLSFILSYIIVILLFKAVGALFSNVHLHGAASVVSKVAGCIVGVCLYVGVIACIFGCIHAFADAGSLQAADEVLRANVVSGFVYRVNPLNGVFNDLGFAPKLLDILHGNF